MTSLREQLAARKAGVAVKVVVPTIPAGATFIEAAAALGFTPNGRDAAEFDDLPDDIDMRRMHEAAKRHAEEFEIDRKRREAVKPKKEPKGTKDRMKRYTWRDPSD